MSNLPSSSPPASHDSDTRAVHDAICVLDDYADDLRAVGCSATRVNRIRAIADALSNLSTRHLLPNETEADEQRVRLMLGQVNWLRFRTFRAKERGTNVELSPTMAADLADHLERFALAIDRAHAAARCGIRSPRRKREARRA